MNGDRKSSIEGIKGHKSNRRSCQQFASVRCIQGNRSNGFLCKFGRAQAIFSADHQYAECLFAGNGLEGEEATDYIYLLESVGRRGGGSG